jgi:hypothetical protein
MTTVLLTLAALALLKTGAERRIHLSTTLTRLLPQMKGPWTSFGGIFVTKRRKG